MQPNFLVFVADQISSRSLGCNGNPVVRTPNIDALAADGISFTRAYCNNPVCMPSRASLITGMTPRHHGVLTNGNSLREDMPTVTQALVERGYRTHSVGKLHLQPFGGMHMKEGAQSWEFGAAWNSCDIRELPSPYYGFQSADYVGGHVNYVFGQYRQWLEANHPGMFERYAIHNAYQRTGQAYRMDIPAELHYNHWIADRSIDFLHSLGQDEPFFLWCSFPDPHFPFAACRPYSEMYPPEEMPLPASREVREEACAYLNAARATWPYGDTLPEDELREIISQTYGMITHIDDNIGRVMSALQARGLDENTIVVFLADHGEYLGNHSLVYKGPWPLEDLWRVPTIWRVPGGSPAQHAVDDTTSLLDFVPTVADFAGIDAGYFSTRGFGDGCIPGLPGRSLRGYFSGEEVRQQPALVEYDEDFHANLPFCRQRGLVDGPWKLVTWTGFPGGLLINLEVDPQELCNLWDDPRYQAEKCRLLELLLNRLTYTDRFDTERIAGA